MKKYILKTIFVLTVILLGYGCSEDFLDKRPTQFISIEDLAETAIKKPDILSSTLSGVYSTMINTGTGGIGGAYDFGQKGYDIFSDMLSSDMALSVNTYGWYKDLVDYNDTVDFTENENYMPWRYYYRIIRATNLIIETLGGNDAVPPTDEGKHTMGQVKALRAYAYFYLSQFYIKEYDPASKILPLYDNPNDPNKPQSTTEEVYNLIIKDLEEAIVLLSSYSRGGITPVNIDVARGLLAYVYGSMGSSATNIKAKNLADQVIAQGGYTLMNYTEVTGGFNDVAIPGWIWGVDITVDTGLGLNSWWGQVDLYTYSYAWAGDAKAIDKGLYNSIKANDVRKNQFRTIEGTYYLLPTNKFYHAEKRIGGQRTVTTDYVFMRVAEMYLLSAEMSAKEGDEATAKTRLKELLSNRFENATDYSYVDALTGKALQDEIYLQTRIELWGEGKSYLAMKRNKATITRGDNHLSLVGEPIPYNDPRLTFEIPQSEIQNNPFIN